MLTPEQTELLAGVVQEWTDQLLGAGPTDRAAAEEGVRLTYRAAGLRPPERLVWCGSQLAGAAAALVLSEPSTMVHSGGLWDRARGELAAQGVASAAGGAGWPLRSHLGPWLWAAARAEIEDQAGDEQPEGLWEEVWARTAGRVALATGFGTSSAGWWERTLDLLATDLADQLRGPPDWSAADEEAVLALGQAMGGPLDAAWHALIDGLGRLLPGAARPRKLTGPRQVTRAAGWWWPFERVAILTPKPVAVHHDAQGRLHRPDGPALCYPDGLGVHAWHGVRIPAAVFAMLPYLRAEDIRRQRNLEVRRVLLEVFGLERYVSEAGATLVHEDATGRLWRAELADDEPLVMVEVRNATPEPDGGQRVYWLRVPPDVETAREAVAWTFGLSAERYRPLRET